MQGESSRGMLGASSNAHGSGRVWAGLAMPGRAPAPRRRPAKVLYVRSMFSDQLVFPWQAPLHIPFPVPRCEAALPCTPRACPAPRTYENKTKAEQAGLDITRAWLGRMLGWSSVSPGAHPQGAGGNSLHGAQRQGTPRVSLALRQEHKVPSAARYPQLPAQVQGGGARWISGWCSAVLGVAKLGASPRSWVAKLEHLGAQGNTNSDKGQKEQGWGQDGVSGLWIPAGADTGPWA